jgi:hypothetical protein
MALTRRGESRGNDSGVDRLLESWGFRWLGNGFLLQLAHKTIAAAGKGLDISGFGRTVP